ncbi:hypothetical protein JKP88DRAFT_234249 [Tribonema minus]|uniref:Uncharacterized protein n=1 Tax=Tribonema minus TaxID=303371 RepID=A0A835Z645_9STRA|nr:hypothetical protein JKP88DRAFT_234249 [Tribonema minus]
MEQHSGQAKMPEACVPFQQPPVDPLDSSADFYGFASLLLGSAASYLGMRVCAWPALLCCMVSLSNIKRSKANYQLALGSVAFCLISLVTTYSGFRQKMSRARKGEL